MTDKILDIIKESQALLNGHFILSSGLHSEYYVQCARLFEKPWLAEQVCRHLLPLIKDQFSEFDVILAPAFGGIFFAYELSRLLKKPNIFVERVEGEFQLRRGFQLQPQQKVLITEDVVTTGKSTRECIKLLESFGATCIGVAAVIDRTRGLKVFEQNLLAALSLNFPTYAADQLPESLAAIPAVKPGSRPSHNNQPIKGVNL